MAAARVYVLSSVVLLAGMAAALLPGSARPVAIPASSAGDPDFNPKSARVYVSLFDINATPDKEPAPIKQTPAPQKPPIHAGVSSESPHVLPDADTNSKRAERLRAFFGDAMVQALRKNGFNAALQGGARPGKGVLLKGVFAEVDSRNHNCLAILGGTAPAPEFLLYVGVYNLARPDQPLFRAMTMENCDARYGPLISLNNYIPMEKYEVSKSPTEDEARKTCAQVVADLTALLRANPATFSN